MPTFTRGLGLHARVYDLLCGLMERRGFLEWRRALVGDLEGDVLEIGTGTGLNLPHYPRDVRVFASEYDPVMLDRARPRVAAAGAETHLLVADAQRLPVPSSSVDAVVAGLMLCSVDDPQMAVGEVERVLRPGGRFRFLEHIRAEDGSRRAKAQDLVNPAWRMFTGGCNANRRSLAVVESAGFEIAWVHDFKFGMPHVAPHVCAEAVLR